MSDQALTTDPAGIQRTETGEIATPTEPLVTEQTTETKTTETETKKPEGETLLSDKKKEEPTGAPDKYEDFKLPEGFELDKEVATEASAVFKELGLNQAGAQKLVDFYSKQIQALIDKPFKSYQEMRNGWREEAGKHPDLAGKLGENGPVRQAFGRLLDSLGDAKLAGDFREAMDFTGAGDHPAFIRAIAKWASMVTEGAHVSGGRPSPLGQAGPNSKPRTAASAMYPNLP